MPVLSNPNLSIKLVTGTNQVEILGTVKVSFSPQEETLIKLLSLKYTLRADLWAEDGGLNGDDRLRYIEAKKINADGPYTLQAKMDRSKLDEDWEGNDEVFARFVCRPPSGTGIALLPAKPKDSPTIKGNF